MGSLKYRIIDNFLDTVSFKNLKDTVLKYDFPWFFSKSQTHSISETNNEIDSFYFAHLVYQDNKVHSAVYENFILEMLSRLGCNAVSNIRINLLTVKEKQILSGWHIDRPYECNTGIFYLNTCNGYTLLDEKEKIKIESVENRMLIFNSQIKHCAVNQTDVARRVVINFNYN
jgi:hypothetical protein